MLPLGCIVQEVDAETFPRAVRDDGVMTASCGGTNPCFCLACRSGAALLRVVGCVCRAAHVPAGDLSRVDNGRHKLDLGVA